MDPLVWQVKWDEDIKQRLITTNNKTGDITLNNLELAGFVLGWLVLELHTTTLKHHHVGMFCDNTSAVSWAFKMRTSKSIPAARLLCMLGLRIHAMQASSLTPLCILGNNNTLADISSRAFQTCDYFAASLNLTSFFNTSFPLPCSASWKMLTLPSKLTLHVMSCVLGKQLTMEQLLKLTALTKNIVSIGSSMSTIGNATPTSLMPHPLNA
eukprot:3481716-Ditylum_brightwellii.AAC.1